MQVILCEDVDNLGKMGEQVKVSPGYARNFLLPRKLAVVADSASARQIEHEMRIIKKREDKRRVELQEVIKGMADLKVEFLAKSAEEGKLFGSITTLHIANKLNEMGHEINRKKIVLKEPIKSLGDHSVALQLGAGVEAVITVVVTADTTQEPEPKVEEVAAEAPPVETATEEPGETPEATDEAAEPDPDMPVPIIKSSEPDEA